MSKKAEAVFFKRHVAIAIQKIGFVIINQVFHPVKPMFFPGFRDPVLIPIESFIKYLFTVSIIIKIDLFYFLKRKLVGAI